MKVRVKSQSSASNLVCPRSTSNARPQNVRLLTTAETAAGRINNDEKDFMSMKWPHSNRKRVYRPAVETRDATEPTAVKHADDIALQEAERRRPYGPDSAYHLYLREIGQTNLLTRAEEVELAKRIKKGDKDARELMIKANLRLVVKIARDYESYGLPLLDLINEGNMGLMKAVERFDPNKGAKLSTYAAWWIKQAIKRGLADQGKTIRLPVHVVDKLFNIRRAEIKLQDVLGREPTAEELGDELGIPAAKIAQMRTAAIRPASLEAPLGDDDSNHISDVIADESAHTPYEELEEKTNVDLIREIVQELDDRERTILRCRFGLDGEGEKTLEEVGVKFGVTRERIRQVQNIALQKLRKRIEKLDAVQLAA